MPTSQPTTSLSVTLIPETRPRKDKVYFSNVWIKAHHELGTVTPMDFASETDTETDNEWDYQCLEVGPDQVAVAMYDREIRSSVILLFPAPVKPGTVWLSTDRGSLRAWLVRHHVPTEGEEDAVAVEETPENLWTEILQETADHRAKDSRCFPLTGKATLALADGDFAESGAFDLQSNGPLPPFHDLVDKQNRFYSDRAKASLEKHQTTRKEYDDGMAMLKRLGEIKSTRPCTLEGKLDHFYVKFPLPVMP